MVADAGQQLQQRAQACGVVADAGLGDPAAGAIDEGDVVVVFGPVDPAKQLRQCSSKDKQPIIGAAQNRSEDARPANRRTRRSDIRSAVRDPSDPRGLLLQELTSSAAFRRSTPQTGSNHEHHARRKAVVVAGERQEGRSGVRS
ncbi:hypothetical protein [Streptosporangium sp. LJ11]|uniref:hypothetical protein n=1 Tax=Streptosporangium sp. LJ11 TaxID=3436927 RepID=UPI003F790681